MHDLDILFEHNLEGYHSDDYKEDIEEAYEDGYNDGYDVGYEEGQRSVNLYNEQKYQLKNLNSDKYINEVVYQTPSPTYTYQSTNTGTLITYP